MKSASGRWLLGFIVSGVVLLLAWWWAASGTPSSSALVTSLSIAEPATSAASPPMNLRSASASKQSIAAVPVVVSAGTPVTFKDAIAKLNQADAVYIKSANTRLYGALDYHSIAELQWKLARGFATIEEVLALRGKPAPPLLSNDEAKLLSAQELTKYFLQKALTAPEKTGMAYDLQLHSTWGLQMDNITRERDTPFPAYLRASMVDITDKSGQSALVRDATSAALNGDGGLLSRAIVDRLLELQHLRSTWDVATKDTIGPKLNHDIASTNNFMDALSQISFSQHVMIDDQVSGCVDRYTGNPRLAEYARQRVQREGVSCK
jgi:hypothetical protein